MIFKCFNFVILGRIILKFFVKYGVLSCYFLYQSNDLLFKMTIIKISLILSQLSHPLQSDFECSSSSLKDLAAILTDRRALSRGRIW